jgi:hypothetical protein
MTELTVTYRRLFGMLMIVFYIYATIGEQLFGGLIRDDTKALENSDFFNDGYSVLNFNDFMSSIVTLFVLMVVNNWFVIAEGFLLVTKTAWSQVFFVSFFVIVNLIVLNIFLALILECFATFRSDLEKLDEAVAKIVQRGFSRHQAHEGLAAMDGSVEEAVRWLEAGGADDEDSSLSPNASPAQRRARSPCITRESVLRRVLLGEEEATGETEPQDVPRHGTLRSVSLSRPAS